jgi:hypothetical protein
MANGKSSGLSDDLKALQRVPLRARPVRVVENACSRLAGARQNDYREYFERSSHNGLQNQGNNSIHNQYLINMPTARDTYAPWAGRLQSSRHRPRRRNYFLVVAAFL